MASDDKKAKRRKAAKAKRHKSGATWTRTDDGRVLVPPAVAREVIDLGGGEHGYAMHPQRHDECFRAALATMLQVPVDQVPDPRLDDLYDRGVDPVEISRRFWRHLADWLAPHGLEVAFHHDALPLDRARWIGVHVVDQVELQAAIIAKKHDPSTFTRAGATAFSDHCFVMARDAVHFDPGVGVLSPPGLVQRAVRLSDITYGITLDPKE